MIGVVAAAYAEPAVLLGVSDQGGALSTWWVTRTAIQKLGSGLAVPRADGWWRVEVVVWDFGGYHAEDLRRVAPDGTVYQPTFSVTQAAGVSGRSVRRVQEVGPDWWSLETELDLIRGAGHQVAAQPSVEAFDPRSTPPLPLAPTTPVDAVGVGPGARLLVKADGLALVVQGDETFEVAAAGPRVVMIRPAPSGDEAAFRAAAVKRLRQ